MINVTQTHLYPTALAVHGSTTWAVLNLACSHARLPITLFVDAYTLVNVLALVPPLLKILTWSAKGTYVYHLRSIHVTRVRASVYVNLKLFSSTTSLEGQLIMFGIGSRTASAVYKPHFCRSPWVPREKGAINKPTAEGPLGFS